MEHVPALDEDLKKTLGPATAKVLAEQLGLHTALDLLHHYPRRYAERGELTPLAELADQLDEHVTVVAQVADARVLTFNGGRGKRLEVTITDGSGRLQLVFFGAGVHKPHKDLLPGTRAMFAGKVGIFNRKLQLSHPAYELLGADASDRDAAAAFASQLIPIYPACAKLESWKISKAVDAVLPSAQDTVDPLPPALREGRGLIPLTEALLKIHRPATKADIEDARQRLKWDEAFVLQVALARRRHADSQLPAVPRLPTPGGLLDSFDAKLPFTLTEGQQTVSKEIFDDLATSHPMHRLLQGEVGSGKAQPLDSLVLTPAGFRPMGDIAAGDEVVVPTGEIALVGGVFPQGVRDVWRVVLSDGSAVECDDEHLWIVGTSCGWHRGQEPKVMTTREIRSDLHEANGSSKWYLPVAVPVDLGNGDQQPLDPYLMGVLIGDGSFRHNLGLSTADEEILAAVEAVVAPDREMAAVPGSRCDYTIRMSGPRGGTRRNPVIQAVRDLGLWGASSHDKFVPDVYKNASVKDRLAVLQGLMDTDGTLDANGMSISFCSASLRLAEDVAWLVRSLGGRARVLPKRTAFNVSVALPEEFEPFRLSRKAARMRPRPKYNTFRRGIRSVEHVGAKPVQCISVEHPSHAYVTDNFTVTHNTMVALRAMLAVVDSGGQAAMLAPTEVLAQQHHRSITEMMGELAEGGMLGGSDQGTKVVLLTGSMGTPARRQALLDLVTGEGGIVIGTHALIEDKVQFHDLGLVVVDEQHRFGVEQRDALRSKGKQPPHLLVMTATPIPRTVAMTVFGDLETSVLDQLPAGRSPIATHVVPAKDKPHFLTRAWERVREEVENGHQAYVVCPRIGDGDDEPKKKKAAEEDGDKRPPLAVLEIAEQLTRGPLAGLSVEVLHGRMDPADKDDVMRRFATGEVKVLVATTVIEVGVNVPNSTVMVIMDADRFGVSQLHQLRGRVGRGSAPGLCLLVSEMHEASPARARLAAVAATLDGFELSRIDLEQRREGDVLGQAQSGVRSSLRMLAVIEDEEVIAQAREEATRVVAADPELEHLPGLRTALDALLDTEREQYLEKG
ncbi:helicase-related protein [Streptomyces sp. NBC_00249]|uniref:helicase-related protein n=1 Tax=Streptomyces sp. NBC_00249 TaxID=2975690 RepID=UPI002257692E|nr:helicase-related protein [Streptomyces sp. NBC_00249]MCX5194125.1 helicase-related protein [Streptomyces sp. NBC_00249]